MSDSAGAGHALRRFFRSPWFAALLAVLAVALLLVAVLGSHHNPVASVKAPGANPAADAPHGSGSASACGHPLGVRGHWQCTFDDEFNGTSLSTANWQPQLTATSGYVTGGPDCYVDNPDTISVSGGHLNLSVLRTPPLSCTRGYVSQYQAGMVTSSTLFNQTYGVFEVRAKVPAATVGGLQETLWLSPQNLTYGKWPASGEIDFAEFFSDNAGLDVPYVHYTDSSSDPDATAYGCKIARGAFNTYAVDWTPSSITILDNGQVCLIDHPNGGPAPFNEPFFIALTQALGEGTNAPTATTPLPATTQIDWVRVWASGR